MPSNGNYALEDPANNTETEDETLAAKKRRSNNRRVSFADNEITSVHIFNRDEDYYDAAAPSDPEPRGSDKAEGVFGLFRDLADLSDDFKQVTPLGREGGVEGEEEEDVGGLEKVFFRPVESPSPGSSTVGSVASSTDNNDNDEDNFFGPVSASFIHPGRLSDSAASNGSHDITMDSTTFSMHFRSLARSDTEGDLKTPSRFPLSFEERTPASTTNSGSLMALTNAKIKFPESASPILNLRSSGKDSNDMSLVGENTNKYDYGQLSPSLDALLGGSQVLQPALSLNNGKSSMHEISTLNDASARKHVGSSPNKEKGIIGTCDASETSTPVHLELVQPKSPCEEVPVVNPVIVYPDNNDLAAPNTFTNSPVQTPNQLLNRPGIQQSPEGSLRPNSLLNVSQKLAAEQDYDRPHGSQMKGSISSLAAKRRWLFANVTTPTKLSVASPSAKLSGSLFVEESARHSSSLSAIWKSISKFKNLDSSLTSASKTQTAAMKHGANSSEAILTDCHPVSGAGKNVSFLERTSPSNGHNLDFRSGHPFKDLCTGDDGALLIDNEEILVQGMSPAKPIRSTYEHLLETPIRVLARSPIVTQSIQSPSKEIHDLQVQNIAKSQQQKRRGEAILENETPERKVARIENSTVETVASSFELSNDFVIGKGKIGNGKQSRHWKDVLTEFLEDTAKMVFPLVDSLDLREVHLLDDMLAYIQIVRKYEVFHSEIQSQQKSSGLSKHSDKRPSDLKFCFSKIAYEKARLLLDRVKHDRLQKAEELLKSLLQESHNLWSVYKISLPPPDNRGPHANNDDDCQVSSADPANEQKIAHGTIPSLRQENDLLGQKIKSLTRALTTHCKMKGDIADCTKVRELANDYLRKRVTCRFVRQDLQAWRVGSLDTGNGFHAITLDYLGLISQRLVVKAHPNPALTISNKLDSVKIEKHCPHLAASTAFAFLFPTQTMEKYVRSRSLVQRTQITNMLLRNLLDVIEEVQLARLQIDNLIDTTFHAPTAGQLHLVLSFIGFNTDQKVKLTFNMTCLIRGVYPSELLPHSLEAMKIQSPAQSLAESVKAVIEELSAGYLRIMRICRCVSKVLEG